MSANQSVHMKGLKFSKIRSIVGLAEYTGELECAFEELEVC